MPRLLQGCQLCTQNLHTTRMSHCCLVKCHPIPTVAGTFPEVVEYNTVHECQSKLLTCPKHSNVKEVDAWVDSRPSDSGLCTPNLHAITTIKRDGNFSQELDFVVRQVLDQLPTMSSMPFLIVGKQDVDEYRSFQATVATMPPTQAKVKMRWSEQGPGSSNPDTPTALHTCLTCCRRPGFPLGEPCRDACTRSA